MDKDLSRELTAAINSLAAKIDRPLRLMEVCGTHTVSIFRAGIRQLLPAGVELVSGPGCPVCVTDDDFMDRAIAVAGRKLVEGEDYRLNYLGDCTSIGTQAVEITCPDTSAFASSVTARYEIVKKKQVISVAGSIQKEPGSAPFELGAKTNGNGKLAYLSSNSFVAAVDESGTVTVGQEGTAVITVSCSGTDTCEEADDVQVRVTVSEKQAAAPAQQAGASPGSSAGKAANPLKLQAKKAVVKYSKVKKRKVVLKRSKVLAVKNAKGKLTFSKVKKGSSKFLSVNKKTGNVTVAKKTKRGTYKLKVKVKAAGNDAYKSADKTATVKVVVK